MNSRRPKAVESDDGRKDNGGRGDGLTAKLQDAIEAAPGDANDLQIASVAWQAWQAGEDPAAVWKEVANG